PRRGSDADWWASQRDLRSHFHRAAVGEPEHVDGACGIARQTQEERLLPRRHGPVSVGSDGDTREEVRSVLEVEVAWQEPALAGEGERLGDIEAVLIAHPHGEVRHLAAAAAQVDHVEAVGWAHV